MNERSTTTHQMDDSTFRNNAFGLLRYYAVICVMLGHYTYYCYCYGVAGAQTPVLSMLNTIPTILPGVVVLFSISGYLVSGSMDRCMDRAKQAAAAPQESQNTRTEGGITAGRRERGAPFCREFLMKRLVRLYPELWGCAVATLVSLLILVPQMLDESMLLWAVTQAVGIACTPSCLKGYATGSVNGALWTVFTELQMYLVLLVIHPLLKRFGRFRWGVSLLAAAAVNVLCSLAAEGMDGAAAKLIERSCVPYFLWFYIGCWVYHCRGILIARLKRLALPLLAVLLGMRFIGFELPGYYVGLETGILCPLIVIGLGYLLPKGHPASDISYGIFLYHWMVLNVLIHIGLLQTGPWIVSLTVLAAATCLLAWLSHRFIGAPAIRWASDRAVRDRTEGRKPDRTYNG